MGARAAGGERGRGARARTCTQYCAVSTSLALYLCVSLKCGVVQCVPLNLDDMKVFWHRLVCARGRVDERTNEFAASHAAWGGGAFVPQYEGLAAKIGQLLVVPLTHVMAAHGCAHDDTPSAPHLAPERVRVRPQLPRSLQTASGGISVGEV